MVPLSVTSWTLISVFLVSLLSFSGALTLVLSRSGVQRVLILLVSFSAGSLIGGAFFHLLPEAIESATDPLTAMIYVLLGFGVFFFLERVLRWHHCHDEHADPQHHLGYLSLFADGLHNFIDGMIIAAGFMAGPVVGVPVAISIALHEIPQEISDFGVLLYSGFSKGRALWYNFISALFSVVGALVVLMIAAVTATVMPIALALAAGGFLYIGASDLIPEIHKERRLGQAIGSFGLFITAVVLMYLIKVFTE